MWKRFVASVSGWFDSADATKDVKLLAFASVVIFSIKKLWVEPIDANWVNAYYGLCALVGLGGSIWAAVDKWKGKNGEPTKESPDPKEPPQEK